MASIDLNSDLGESFGAWQMGDDASMLEIVTSANLACGFHAGDPAGMLKTLKAAADAGVAVGAHVAYPDLAGFGRRYMEVTFDELYADVIYQIGALSGLARATGTRVRYVKPHGALYHAIAHDEVQGQAVIEALKAVDDSLVLLALAGSPLVTRARAAGLSVAAEAFADRHYHADGRLVSRRAPGAVLHDAGEVAARMQRLAREGLVESIEGADVRVAADSICVHGDSPGAVALARAVREGLEADGIRLGAFSAKNARDAGDAV